MTGRRRGGKLPRDRPSRGGFGSRVLRAQASDAAALVQRSYPSCFETPRTDVVELAKLMGLSLANDPGLLGRAYVEHEPRGPRPQALPGIWGPTVREMGDISLKPGMNEMTKRFAIAHEIGHVELEGYPEIARDLEPRDKERFANVFAAEILISLDHRLDTRRRFTEATTVEDLMELAGRLGVSPWTLLIFADEHGWFDGSDVVWLEVRLTADPDTNQDTRLRVYRRFLDQARYRLQEGATVADVFGDDSWLVEEAAAATSRNDLELSLGERPDRRASFRAVKRAVDVSALRMKESQWVGTPQILVGARIKGS